jgi:hypothetical protein
VHYRLVRKSQVISIYNAGKTELKKLLDADTYTKARILKTSLLGLAVLFWQPLAAFYQHILIEPVLSKVVSTKLNDLVFGLGALLGGLLLAALARRAYRPGHLQVVTLTMPGLLYLTVRSWGGKVEKYQWHFTPFSVTRWLHYADLLVLPLIGVVMLGLLARRQARRSPPFTDRSYLEEDAPATTADTLGRDREAQRLMAQLGTLRPSTAFAVGIVGPWGSGKTRFLDLMAQHLPAQAILLRFNPWLVESTAAIRKEFFTALKDQLGRYSGELAAELGTYANSLAGVSDSAAAKVFKESVALLTDTPSLTEQFEKVNQVISCLNRPIFIFLDDIDRLDKDEVLETLRIVRNTASFGRVIFVLAYDRAYVLEAIHRTNQANSSQYLDKIVQLEVALPNFRASVLAERTMQLLEPPIQDKHPACLPELTRLLGGRTGQRPARAASETLGTTMQPTDGYRCYYPELITTMRGAVRFANLFTYDYLPLAGEVRLDEFLNLTLVKLRFPALYEALKTRRILDSDLSRALSTGTTVLSLSREKLTKLLEQHLSDEHERELATGIIEHLFSRTQLATDERTIQRPSTFDIYFSAGSFSNVSLLDIEQLRTGSVKDIDHYLNRWGQANQLEEAFEALASIDVFNDRRDFENVATAGLLAGRQLHQVTGSLRWLLRLNTQRSTLVQLYGGSRVGLADWLEYHFYSAPAPYLYEADLLRELRAEYRHDKSFEFILSDATLGDLALRYLTEHLLAYQKADRTAFNLHWASVEGVDEHNRVLTDERANLLMRRVLEANPSGDVAALVVPVEGPGYRPLHVFQPLLPRIFGSWDGFEAFLKQAYATSNITHVQREFAQFKAAGYEPY